MKTPPSTYNPVVQLCSIHAWNKAEDCALSVAFHPSKATIPTVPTIPTIRPCQPRNGGKRSGLQRGSSAWCIIAAHLQTVCWAMLRSMRTFKAPKRIKGMKDLSKRGLRFA